MESEARRTCTAALDRAYNAPPDFRGGDFVDAKDLIDTIPALRAEAAEAGRDPLVHLLGSGSKADFTKNVGRDDVSPSLMDIRMRLTTLPEATDAYWTVPRNAEERREWIAANKDIIVEAAQRSGLPPDMVAGIIWQEVGGQWGWMDDGVDTIRELAEGGWLNSTPENLPSRLGGSPDETRRPSAPSPSRWGGRRKFSDTIRQASPRGNGTPSKPHSRTPDRTSSSPPSTWPCSRKRAASPTYRRRK
ncbi:hypothetical protein [Streptomyces sp. NPDC029526]|uniref:hypothetical protein n=1 Tax=Streptomyces sp. NPDC029526 TaxID=3155728 RepID=UPI0033CC9220